MEFLDPMTKPRIVHLITGLTTGGAEMMLLKLCANEQEFEHVVIALNGRGDTQVANAIRDLGVELYCLNLKQSKNYIGSLVRMVGIVRRTRPVLIQSWMYHANALGVLVKLFTPRVPLAWNIRHSVHDLKEESRIIRGIIFASRFMMPWVTRVVFNSRVSMKQHIALGYCRDKSVVLPNGFDLSVFRSNLTERNDWRAAHGIGADEYLMVVVARYHPMKGHALFLEAYAALSRSSARKVKAILVGKGADQDNHQLQALIRSLGLSDHVLLLGEQRAVAPILNGCDMLVSPSLWGEGFSNVIGEAMALGKYCVATNVGDAEFLIDRFGAVVQPNDASKLCEAMRQGLELDDHTSAELAEGARNRIQNYFSIQAIAHSYADLYRQVLATPIRPVSTK